MKLAIRRVQSVDIGALRSMATDFMTEFESKLEYPGMDQEEVDTHMLEILANLNNPEGIYLIAYDGKKPAGFFVGWVGNKPYSKPRRVGVAQELYVVPEKRAGIVGMRLMEEAGRIAIERGAQGLECIGTWAKQPDGTYSGTATRWEKFGFKPYVSYGFMEPSEFMGLVRRFSRGRAA